VNFEATDIILGRSDSEDFENCIHEIAHIRSCLQMSTQSSKRRTRNACIENSRTNTAADDMSVGSDSDSNSDSISTGSVEKKKF